MNPQVTDERIRPVFLVIMVCSLVAILLAVGIASKRKAGPAPANTTEETSAVSNPAVARLPRTVSAPRAAATASPTPVEEKWGIQISSVSLAMAGAAVDVRYKVVAPEKATLLSDGRTDIYLIDQNSGTKIAMGTPQREGGVPTGSRAHSVARSMRQQGAFPPAPTRLTAGRTNSLLLPNLGRTLQKGSVVTVVVGDIKLDNLTVE